MLPPRRPLGCCRPRLRRARPQGRSHHRLRSVPLPSLPPLSFSSSFLADFDSIGHAGHTGCGGVKAGMQAAVDAAENDKAGKVIEPPAPGSVADTISKWIEPVRPVFASGSALSSASAAHVQGGGVVEDTSPSGTDFFLPPLPANRSSPSLPPSSPPLLLPTTTPSSPSPSPHSATNTSVTRPRPSPRVRLSRRRGRRGGT